MGRGPLVVAPGWRDWRRLDRRARSLTGRDARAIGPWMVLAPHPDDEALGGGALLATLCAGGARPHLAFVTDGAASHPDSPGWTPARLAGARRREGASAARALGLDRAPLWLDWSDARPPAVGSRAWRRTVRRLGAHLRRHQVRQLVTSWGAEGHCDHAAAARLADAAAKASRRPVRVTSVAVWGWTEPGLARQVGRRPVTAIAVAAGRPAAARALRRHRSQLGTRIPGGFRLPRALWRLVERPRLILIEGSGA